MDFVCVVYVLWELCFTRLVGCLVLWVAGWFVGY